MKMTETIIETDFESEDIGESVDYDTDTGDDTDGSDLKAEVIDDSGNQMLHILDDDNTKQVKRKRTYLYKYLVHSIIKRTWTLPAATSHGYANDCYLQWDWYEGSTLIVSLRIDTETGDIYNKTGGVYSDTTINGIVDDSFDVEIELTSATTHRIRINAGSWSAALGNQGTITVGVDVACLSTPDANQDDAEDHQLIETSSTWSAGTLISGAGDIGNWIQVNNDASNHCKAADFDMGDGEGSTRRMKMTDVSGFQSGIGLHCDFTQDSPQTPSGTYQYYVHYYIYISSGQPGSFYIGQGADGSPAAMCYMYFNISGGIDHYDTTNGYSPTGLTFTTGTLYHMVIWVKSATAWRLSNDGGDNYNDHDLPTYTVTGFTGPITEFDWYSTYTLQTVCYLDNLYGDWMGTPEVVSLEAWMDDEEVTVQDDDVITAWIDDVEVTDKCRFIKFSQRLNETGVSEAGFNKPITIAMFSEVVFRYIGIPMWEGTIRQINERIDWYEVLCKDPTKQFEERIVLDSFSVHETTLNSVGYNVLDVVDGAPDPANWKPIFIEQLRTEQDYYDHKGVTGGSYESLKAKSRVLTGANGGETNTYTDTQTREVPNTVNHSLRHDASVACAWSIDYTLGRNVINGDAIEGEVVVKATLTFVNPIAHTGRIRVYLWDYTLNGGAGDWETTPIMDTGEVYSFSDISLDHTTKLDAAHADRTYDSVNTEVKVRVEAYHPVSSSTMEGYINVDQVRYGVKIRTKDHDPFYGQLIEVNSPNTTFDTTFPLMLGDYLNTGDSVIIGTYNRDIFTRMIAFFPGKQNPIEYNDKALSGDFSARPYRDILNVIAGLDGGTWWYSGKTGFNYRWHMQQTEFSDWCVGTVNSQASPPWIVDVGGGSSFAYANSTIRGRSLKLVYVSGCDANPNAVLPILNGIVMLDFSYVFALGDTGSGTGDILHLTFEEADDTVVLEMDITSAGKVKWDGVEGSTLLGGTPPAHDYTPNYICIKFDGTDARLFIQMQGDATFSQEASAMAYSGVVDHVRFSCPRTGTQTCINEFAAIHAVSYNQDAARSFIFQPGIVKSTTGDSIKSVKLRGMKVSLNLSIIDNETTPVVEIPETVSPNESLGDLGNPDSPIDLSIIDNELRTSAALRWRAISEILRRSVDSVGYSITPLAGYPFYPGELIDVDGIEEYISGVEFQWKADDRVQGWKITVGNLKDGRQKVKGASEETTQSIRTIILD